jgi:hypothetical protein
VTVLFLFLWAYRELKGIKNRESTVTTVIGIAPFHEGEAAAPPSPRGWE